MIGLTRIQGHIMASGACCGSVGRLLLWICGCHSHDGGWLVISV
jgi:hypothetical protein